MWEILSRKDKDEYKKLILAFASLTEVFAQKADTESINELSPIINSKFQETIFQKAFNATAEDIGNTSYDASIRYIDNNSIEHKYLIGIKTFGIASGYQKIAQFKSNHNEWSNVINAIQENSKTINGSKQTKAEIDNKNKDLYQELAVNIAKLRNSRIDSSVANIQGFSESDQKANKRVESVYHVLMPSKKGESPSISVGEISYDKINIEKIEVLGCTGINNPTNFEFTDGNHRYRYTAADSQLLMDFSNKDIVVEKWDVKYSDDAYSFFRNIAQANESKPSITESYSWLITNANGEVEQFSGFNSFWGTGSKLTKADRQKRIKTIIDKHTSDISKDTRLQLSALLTEYLVNSSTTRDQKLELRQKIIELLNTVNNYDLKTEVKKIIFRPQNEIYIPLPNARDFHANHPSFFAENAGNLVYENNDWKLTEPKESRKFNLIFEPSGTCIEAFITQSSGKAIQSWEKQSYLGEWILQRVFQLSEYEPLTAKRLNEIGINGIRIYRTNSDNDVHLSFIWIDNTNLPDDYIK